MGYGVEYFEIYSTMNYCVLQSTHVYSSNIFLGFYLLTKYNFPCQKILMGMKGLNGLKQNQSKNLEAFNLLMTKHSLNQC